MSRWIRLIFSFLAATVGIAVLGSTSFADSPFVKVGPDKTFQAPRVKDVRSVDPLPEHVEWKVPVAPYIAPKFLAKKPIPLELPLGNSLRGYELNQTGTRAIVGYALPGAKTTQFISCDLEKGSVIRRFEVPGAWDALSLSGDGAYAVFRKHDDARGKKDTLQVWNIADTVPSLQLEFVPHPYYRPMSRDIRMAAWLPKFRLMTVCLGVIAIWDLKTGQMLYWLGTQQPQAYPALSPDRRQLAFTTKTNVGILDIEEGKVLASQPVSDPLATALLSFSPDGLRLACRTPENVFIWNVADGALSRHLTKSEISGGVFRWTSPKDLLIGSHLVDVDLGLAYWDYKGSFRIQTVNSVTWLLVPARKGVGGSLIGVELPRVDARQALKKAASDPSVLVLKAGTKVKLDVSALKDADEQARARDALTKSLEKRGFKVDPAGTITLAALTDSHSEPVELKYRLVEKKGDKNGPIKQYKFKVYFARLRFIYNGRTVWESSAHNLPGDITLELGETAEEHLKKYEYPKYEFFQTAALPQVLVRTKGGSLLGASQVMPFGIR